MDFINNLSSSLEKKLSDGVAKITASAKKLDPSRQRSDQLNNASFDGPFLKFNGTDLENSVNRYSVLVIIKPGSVEAPNFVVSTGAPTSAPLLLDQYADHRIWRVEFNIPLLPQAQAVHYSINSSKNYTFHIPGLHESYRWVFTSCNGFSSDVTEEEIKTLNNIHPLWNDILRDHRVSPFHAQVGGGDQCYMDNVWRSESLKAWINNPNKEYKRTSPFTEEMNRDAHRFYWDNYMNHFKENHFAEALATIPYNFTWDDHDIFDGYGSYPDYLNLSPVIQNLFVAAQRFYLLFQQHTNLAQARKDGFIGVHGHSTVTQYGPYMAVICTDVRTERNLSQIISPESWKMVYAAIDQVAPSTRHLIWGATIPLVWPRIVGEAAVSYAGQAMTKMTSALDGLSSIVTGGEAGKDRSVLVKLFQKTAVYSSVLNSLGEPELLDDLNDHWTAENHESERLSAIEWFQEFSRRRGNCRVTMLSGDVHCAGVGKLYSSDTNVRQNENKDYRLMMQIVSSAIGNKPPPDAVISVLHKSSKELVLNQHTKENMCPVFLTGVNDQPLVDQYVLGARNYCRVVSSNSNSLLFEIMVEKVVGDREGLTKSYRVMVPELNIS